MRSEPQPPASSDTAPVPPFPLFAARREIAMVALSLASLAPTITTTIWRLLG